MHHENGMKGRKNLSGEKGCYAALKNILETWELGVSALNIRLPKALKHTSKSTKEPVFSWQEWTSPIMYGSETWLTKSLKSVESVYTSTLKQLLGVRPSTCTDVILVDAGVCDAYEICQRQGAFFRKLMEWSEYQGSYWQRLIDVSYEKITGWISAERDSHATWCWLLGQFPCHAKGEHSVKYI